MARRGKEEGPPDFGLGGIRQAARHGLDRRGPQDQMALQCRTRPAMPATARPAFASGMLPIALGEATKTVPYVMDGTKIYRFTVAWGAERHHRRSGKVPSCRPPTSGRRTLKILALLPKYTGVIMQKPPTFSGDQDRWRTRL